MSARVDELHAPPLVLVVDDEPVQRRLMRAAIKRCGMRVEEAVDGASALAALSRCVPDLVLLDLVMPDLDGFEVCMRLRALPPSATTPVLIMTALDDTASIERAYECGATDFITKPVRLPILGHRLRYMLRAARTENALRRSVDELRRSNEQLHEARNQLVQSEKMASIGQLAAGVAHEINNPIGYVKSNLGSLDNYLKQVFTLVAEYERAEALITDTGARASLTAAKAASELDFLREDVFALTRESREGISRVAKIVQDLKDFSHAGSEDEWVRADLHEGLDSTINIVNNEIKNKADLTKDYGVLPQIECLPSQLNQVFMNMLVNAAQAIENYGSITVRTGASADDVWIEISDTGNGIAPEHINRIFDPFFTTKPVGKGTGLGLALSYSIVQEHRGRIEVKSAPGRGTAFRVTLPVHHGTAAPTDKSHAP